MVRSNPTTWLLRGLTAFSIGLAGCSTDDAGTATPDVSASRDAEATEDDGSFAEELRAVTNPKSGGSSGSGDGPGSESPAP